MPEPKVLVVEDEQSLDRVIVDAFRLIGISAETARSGREALERFENQTYDLVILDVRLPDGFGGDILRQIRQISPSTAVLVMTAYAGGEEVDNALAQGVDALLFKPFEMDTLLASAKRLLISRFQSVLEAPPAYAVVQMDTPPSLKPQPRSLLQPNDLVILHGLSAPIMGCVQNQDDQLLCVRLPLLSEHPPRRVQVEWVGEDALYRFRTQLIEHQTLREQQVWLLKQPIVIQRYQRRRHPRLPAEGRIVISDETRLRRTFEGELIDLSEEGLCVIVPFEPRRGSRVSLQGVWNAPTGSLPFEVEAEVCYVVATNRERKPIYRIGLKTDQMPQAVKDALRQVHRAQLVEEV